MLFMSIANLFLVSTSFKGFIFQFHRNFTSDKNLIARALLNLQSFFEKL